MAAQEGSTLAPGFRFHPTDEELVRYYLKRKLTGRTLHVNAIAVVDIYKFEPWELPSQSMLKTKDLEWYFFTCLDKKYGSGSRTNRATEMGYWKTTGKDRPIKHLGRDVGMKKTLVYHQGRAPKGNRMNWVMHEYRMVDPELAQAGVNQNAFVVCRIFEKSGSGPKNGEKYGAPLVEEEWENKETAPVLVGGVVGDFIETLDLDQQKLNNPMGIAGSPSTFYYGECSRYQEGLQEPIEEQKPLIGTDGVFEPQIDHDFNVTELYAGDMYSLNGGDNGELCHNGNPVDLFNAADDLDAYLEANDFSQICDGSFLETDDLLNPVEGGFAVPGGGFAAAEGGFAVSEGDFAVADPADMDMLEEYLKSYSDEDDISKYISFDSPQSVEGDNSVLAPQQNVEGDDAAASENTNPFVKKANELLAKIPAAPAFASEYPSKDIALCIRSAPQSSNAANVTTAMVSITNVTISGNVRGKNGMLNNIISAGFSHSDVAIMVPVSVSGLLCSKTAFVVAHGWIFMVLFSVLFLSITYKIGSCMCTNK